MNSRGQKSGRAVFSTVYGEFILFKDYTDFSRDVLPPAGNKPALLVFIMPFTRKAKS